ncbi:hypothetical protein V5799_020981 [Amblyomma americanum]|uniref:Uncharacterized protein n=1 Tax=Amblyomma americanum TaxID=6943 RepID=A0AAQ4FS63_AMBAM
MSSGAVLLATSNAMEAIFGLAFLFVPPFLPKSITPTEPTCLRLHFTVQSGRECACTCGLTILFRYFSQTEYERRRILEVDFPLVYVRPESDERGSKVLVALPVQTARTPALESTLVEPNGTGAEKTTESDSSEASDSEAEVPKVAQGVKRRKRRSNITLTTA